MNRKSLTIVLAVVILSTTIVISTLFLNSPHHSLAANRISAAPNLQSPSSLPTNGILSGNIFYGSDGSSVDALNATTGVPIWKYHLQGYARAWLLGIHHGTVYISLSNCTEGLINNTLIAALNATNGSLVWLSSRAIAVPSGEVGSFQIVNGNIYFIVNEGENSTLFAYKASDGSSLWWSLSPVESRVVSQGSIYTYSYNINGQPFPKICALNANDGSVRWCYQNAPMFTYANGIVYANFFSTGASYAIALNANNGSLLWSVSGMQVASVVQNVVFATNQNVTEALDASNGALLMKYQNASFLFSHNGKVYAVDSSNDLEAFRQSDGTLLWHYNFLVLCLKACLPPKKGVLYCLSYDYHTEFALNATNGTFLWKYNLGSIATNYPSPCSYAFNNVLYCIGNGNQTLFALNATSGTLLWKHGLSASPDISIGLQTALTGITYVLTCNDSLVVHLHAYNAMNGTLLWKY